MLNIYKLQKDMLYYFLWESHKNWSVHNIDVIFANVCPFSIHKWTLRKKTVYQSPKFLNFCSYVYKFQLSLLANLFAFAIILKHWKASKSITLSSNLHTRKQARKHVNVSLPLTFFIYCGVLSWRHFWGKWELFWDRNDAI